MDAVEAQSAIILSAYRTPETNAMLERTTFGVAENSQHLYGRALDIRIGARLADETPPNWWTPLLNSDGSGKVSNGPGTASFYG